MIYKFKTGGRPLTLDTDLLLSELKSSLPQVKQSLAEWRKVTSGFRNEEVLGTSTKLPEWLEVTYDTLSGIGDIDLATARELKSYFKIIRGLRSRRRIDRETALEPIISKEYLRDIEKAGKSFSKLGQAIRKMKKKERAEFFKSSSFQYARSFRTKRYKRIRDWAIADSGQTSLTYRQAYAYLLARRLEDGLSSDFDIEGVSVSDYVLSDEELPFGEE